MIKLSSAAQQRFSHLASVPTHAYCNFRAISHAPGITGITDIRASYIFGTLDANGNFIVNPHCGTFQSSLPKQGVVPGSEDEKTMWRTLVTNLFSVGEIPDPSDPTKTIPMAAKKERADCKTCDIDAIMSHAYQELSGEAMPYSGAL